MTTTEQIQELQNSVTALQTQISSLSSQLSTQTNTINLHIVDSDDDISDLSARASLLETEDTEIHQEIHTVALEVDNHESRINNLEVNNQSNVSAINNLEQTDLDLAQDIIDMDVEHHQELHLLANAIDGHTTRLNSLEIFQAETPNQVVMSEQSYEALGTPDYDTYYYTYDEDDL